MRFLLHHLFLLALVPVFTGNPLLGAPAGVPWQVSLDPRIVHEVPVTINGATTFIFPEKIKKTSAESFFDKPGSTARCQFVAHEGSEVLTVRMVPGFDTWEDVLMKVMLERGFVEYRFRLVRGAETFAAMVDCFYPDPDGKPIVIEEEATAAGESGEGGEIDEKKPEPTPFEKEIFRLEQLPVTRIPIRSQPLHVAVRTLANAAGMAYIAPNESEFKELVTIRIPAGNPWEVLGTLKERYRFEHEFSKNIWTFYRPRDDEMVLRTYQLRHNDLSSTKITPPSINVGLNDDSSGGNTTSSSRASSGGAAFERTTDNLIKGVQKILEIPVTGLDAVVAAEGFVQQASEFPPVGYSVRLSESGKEKTSRTFVEYIPSSNRLLVGAPRQSHRYVEEYLKMVDRPQRQMSIRVLFVELNRDTESTLGLDPTVSGNFDFSVDGTSEGAVNRLKFATPTATIVNTAALNLKLQAMAAEGRGEISNRATVVAINNEETQFSSGLQVPIQRTSFSTPSSAGTQTQGDIQYIDIGIDTRMLPKILDDSEAVAGREPIRLNLALSISAEAGTATVNGESYPKIAKRTYGLPAIVKNGETLVIGGLAETVESSSETRVPVLGQIPVLGWLFKSKGKSSKNRVLNAYITPVLDPLPVEEPKFADMKF